MNFATGLQALACPHHETTPADPHGYAICLWCGATFPVELTPYVFEEAFQAALRNGRKKR